MKQIQPAYYSDFHCIADKCPDSCCQEWDVLVDAVAAAKYRAIPGPLGDRLRQALSEDEDGNTVMTIEEGRCPMWRQDGLCRIQAELGEEALCQVCRDFPRLRHDYGYFLEFGLELSCPEAARLILNSPPAPPVVTELPGGDPPEYDREAMEILLKSREEIVELILSPDYTPEEALAIGLLFGYHVQGILDGDEFSPFDPDAALEEAREFAKPADIQQLLDFYKDLDILTDRWRETLESPAAPSRFFPMRTLARYGVERYWLQAVSDYDLVGRVKMTVAACLLVKALGGDPIRVAQLYSKEVENSAENTDRVLDAAYCSCAFTDEKLLGWLLISEKNN